jgi:hypothetical protein
MKTDLRPYHLRLTESLKTSLVGNMKKIHIKKKSVSNLFRYEGRVKQTGREVDLRLFNKPLYLDAKAKTLEVQGLATYEDIVDFTLPFGFLPLIAPELKHITVGGATVGIGIESNSYKYGFVHDGLLEAEVLLPDGEIVVCTPTNQYSDLFYALPNSYGTLGYILKVKIQLRQAENYVELHTEQFTDYKAFLMALKAATKLNSVEYIESLIYSKQELYLVIGRQTNKPANLMSIYGGTIFYKEISHPGSLCLTTKDYIFRYDPEWFWAIPDSPLYRLFRACSPKNLRNSSFYTRYLKWQRWLSGKLSFYNFEDSRLEQLIQDWEVPWQQADTLLSFALETFDLDEKPLMATPIKTTGLASCYPMLKDELYFNLGSYGYVVKQSTQPDYYNTKIMDKFCFDHQGIKMLYSTTFIGEAAFNKVYDGQTYKSLKKKYDPRGLLPSLFEKAVKSR